MCLKENKDNLRTIICKMLVAKRNKPDWNESYILTFSPQFHVADGTTTARWWARAGLISNKWWCHVQLKLPSPRKRLYLKFPNQKPGPRRPFGTGLVRHCPQELFSPFFTFLLRDIFFRPFRLSLAPLSSPGSPRMGSEMGKQNILVKRPVHWFRLY